MRAILTTAVVLAALTFAGASTGAARASGYGPTTLTIVTVPGLAGVHFALDGTTYVTGRGGRVRIQTTNGSHLLQILTTRLHTRDVRSTFLRWGDNQYKTTRTITIGHNTVLDAGFQQSVLVHFAFADLAGRPVVGRVSRVTLSNTLGSRVSFAPSWPQWLRATGLARRFTGLEPTYIEYSIEKALVSGSNVVNQSQQRFYPARTPRVTARLLLYSARVSVRDFLFGTSTGSALDLVYPSGTKVPYPLKGHTLLLPSLPRGTYQIRVEAGGYVPVVSLALSKNQVLDVKVVSYLDMLLLLLLVLGSVSVLILVPRPFLRLRLRALGSGRSPTPDDLEPPKPLSDARKKMIDRYMPEPEASPPLVPRMPVARLGRAVVPTGEGKGERSLRKVASRPLQAAVASLRRCRDRARPQGLRQRLRPAAGTELKDETLKGERIDLLNVYMRAETTPAQHVEPQVPQSEAVPTTRADAEAAAPATVEAADVPPAAPTGLEAVTELSAEPVVDEEREPEPGVNEDAAPLAEESLAPAPEESAAPAPEESVAPAVEAKPEPAPVANEDAVQLPEESVACVAEESAASAVEEKPEPGPEAKVDAIPQAQESPAAVPEESAAPAPAESATSTPEESVPSAPEDSAASVAEQTSAPPPKRAAPARRKKPAAATGRQSATPAKRRNTAARRKPAAAQAKTTAQPARKRTPAKTKSTTAASGRTTNAATQKTQARAKQKEARTTKKATTPAATQRRAGLKLVPETPNQAASNGEAAATTGAAGKDDLARLWSDLAATVEALQEDLKKVCAATAEKSRSSTDSVPR